MNDIQILRYNGQKIMDIIQSPLSIAEQEQQIKELLKDIEGEVIIEKTCDGDFERISKVDVKPIGVNLFRQFDARGADASFMALTRLYAGYLWCQKTGETKALYDALLNYKRVTNYPITECCPDNAEWMMLETSMLIDETLIQGKVSEQSKVNESSVSPTLQYLWNVFTSK